MGDFVYNGKRYYNAKHEAIVSRELYYLCQRVIKSKTTTKNNRKNFLFSNIIKCSTCGCMHVGEIKKGKYIYYHCTGNKGGNCKKNYLKEAYVEEIFLNTLDMLTIPADLMPVIIKLIKDHTQHEYEYNEANVAEAEKRIQLLKNRLNKMFNLFIDGELDKDIYNEKRKEFEEEIDELNTRLQILNENPGRIIDFSTKLLELFKDARGVYLRASFEKRKDLINLLCSNFFYDGENLTIAIKKAFLPIVKIASFKNGGRWETRTLDPLLVRETLYQLS